MTRIARYGGAALIVMLTAVLMQAAALDAASARETGPNPRAELPKHYPADFQGTGFVRSLDVSANRLGISGTSYRFDPNVRVHSPVLKYTTIQAIDLGDAVGIRYEADAGSAGEIVEIWLLPEGYLHVD